MFIKKYLSNMEEINAEDDECLRHLLYLEQGISCLTVPVNRTY